ncbi:hypothetical protein TWF569_001654 [Orbilia oligospora]|nr:hypothetical protein TWF706_002768 [Orbilia oligospora]KAF3123732.1 hypothetical protein TWF569_001654 [Orbilia oligospora]
MPRRKHSRPSPHKGHGPNTRFANRLSHPNPATPTNGKRGKLQRRLLLGDDFALNPCDDPSSLGGHSSFTLQQEARNTEERYYRRNDDRKLRQLGITFVRSQQQNDQSSEPNTPPPTNIPKQNPLPSPETTPTGPESPATAIATTATATATVTRKSHLEPVNNLTIHPLPNNYIGSYLKAQNELSSSEEEVVFVPRNQRRSTGTQPIPQKCKAQTTIPSAPLPKSASTPRNPKISKEIQKSSRQSKSDGNDYDDDDGILTDYIRNIEENGEDIDDIFSLRPLGNYLDDIDTGNEIAHRKFDPEGNELGMYVDINTAAIIGKRKGRFGPEYHFKPAGSMLQEALWLEGTDMTHDIQHLIDHFEAGLGDSDCFSSGHEDSDAREPEVQGDADSDSDKAFRFEGDDEEEEEEEFDVEELVNMMFGKSNKQGKFPRASKLADAYDEFDIMDRERISLADPFNRKSRKANIGRSSNKITNTEIDSDEAQIQIELEQYILADREKKKIRKQERHMRRQTGTLNTCSTPTKSGSMDIKGYLGGVTMSQVRTSIKQFLMSGVAERLSLPPMHKQDRLEIHILAHSFFMQSKSQGKGNNRFPVLYKTKQSRLFEGDEKAIDILLSKPNGRARRAGFGNNRGKVSRQPTGGSGGDRTIHNRDGTIVGTGAAELSQGNKGYDMLAKMGWTTGTGLGSNRTGILDPVQAIVKNSRAGLG